MSKIIPTVGRVVLYWPDGEGGQDGQPSHEPLSASIAKVWTDECINIGYLDANGVAFNATSVALIPSDGEPTVPGSGGYCTWMPYQIGQAEKTGR